MGIRQLYDGLLSALSGAGRPFDRGQTCYIPNILSDQEIEAAFRASWLMRKIITKPATEMTRAGRDWQADKEAIEKIEAEEKRLGIKGKLQRAEVLRGKGGGGMVLYLKGDADQSQPIDPKRIGLEGLARVHVWHRSRFSLGPAIENWDDPWFGHPSWYEVQLGGASAANRVRFHPSRVIAFRGKEIDDVNFGADRWWWGDSMVEVVKEAVDNVHTGENAFAKLIKRSAVRRLSVPRLFEKVATADSEGNFKKRVSAVAAGENSDDITWLDGGDGEGKGAETMTDAQMSWTGIPDIKASYLAVAAAAANMPATVLLGKSPDGMNATGSSDADLWEQEVKARQDLEHRPCLDQLDVALIPSALGKVDDSVWWEFAPLSMMSEKDRATTDKTKAETVKIYADSGLLPASALEKGVQNMLVEDGVFPGFDDALGELPEEERFPSRLAEEPDDETINGGKEADPTSAGGGATAQRPARRAANDVRFADGAEPKTLYIQRKLLNADEVIRWAKSQGLETTLAAEDMHVTVARSRAPVDWFSVGTDWSGDEKGNIRIKPGGPREVRRLDEGDAVALLFGSDDLEWRHKRIIEAGASWDWPDYHPHVTLSWNAPGVDVSTIEPYTGPLVFGPELFSEVREDWKSKITEE